MTCDENSCSAVGISREALGSLRDAFSVDPRNRMAMNAVTKAAVESVALNREVVASLDHTYSHQLKTREVTNQMSSGRCWMFAGLNVFRTEAMKSLNLEKFELSQSYTMFWDKLEKSNYFLESILETVDEPIDGRLLMHLLRDPIQDGGQWDMFANLIRKYGVVPKTAMPETHSSSSSGSMNRLLTARLREYARELRERAAGGEELDSLRARKHRMLTVLYRMLCIHLGEPPTEFLWQWRDKDDQFHRDGLLTPLQFYEKHVAYDLESMCCLINCPTRDKHYETLYTIAYLGNVREGEIIRYLNLPVTALKRAAADMIVAGKPVWFGCDVGKMLERELGILHEGTYEFEYVYGEPYSADKAARVEYGESCMTHAMVLTGVDLDHDGAPRKWRVENSWGDKGGDKGFLVMSDRWFDEYVYEVAVEKHFVDRALLPILETEPVVLPPWDPMGALARESSDR
jgi:bleomycin hydrolase